MKETQPFRFFGIIAALIACIGFGLMLPVVTEFLETGLVPRMPSWTLGVALMSISLLTLFTGLILDSVARGRAEQKRMAYLNIPARRGQRHGLAVEMDKRRSDSKPVRRAA